MNIYIANDVSSMRSKVVIDYLTPLCVYIPLDFDAFERVGYFRSSGICVKRLL